MELLHDADGWVAVDKSAGLAATGRDLDDHDCVQYQLEQQLGARVWALHQLDRGTSGVLLFVRKKSLVAPGQAALSRGQKTYLALVHGVPERQVFEVDAPMRYVKRQGRPAIVADGKPALTRFRVRSVGPAHAWIEARPTTGRTHQIRVHLASKGHPLVGDSLHGDCEQHSWAALHAWRFMVGELRLEAPLPAPLRDLSAQLRLNDPTVPQSG